MQREARRSERAVYSTRDAPRLPHGVQRIKRIERVKLYPTPAQTRRLEFCLDVCRELYNAALWLRRDAWRTRRRSISHKTQYAQLTELRSIDARFGAVYRELQDAALHKLDLAMAGFFARVRRGQVPGFPRFRAKARYGCLEFPHGDRALRLNVGQSKVRVPGVGSVRLRKGRSMQPFGRAMVVRSARGWFALLECERAPAAQPAGGAQVGVDLNCADNFCATSDGRLIEHPRWLERRRHSIERAQRRVSRRKRGGANRRNAVRSFARAMDKLRWARRDFHHKLARRLVDAYDVIAVEALKVCNMTHSAKGTIERPGAKVRQKAGLNRAWLDGAPAQFIAMLVSKAEEAARQVIKVNPKHTSQRCARCGHVDPASRQKRCFVCTACGHEDHADVNAAKNILQRAQLELAGRGAAMADPDDPKSALAPVRNRFAQPSAA